MRIFIPTIAVLGMMFLVFGTSETAGQQPDRPLKILSKPNAKTNGDCSGSGSVRLRVTFDKTAVVTNVEELELSGCQTFNRNAVRAAKSIKFQTAIKNGEEISVTRLIEYKYEVY